jgi:hypothetical protein
MGAANSSEFLGADAAESRQSRILDAAERCFVRAGSCAAS